MPHFLTPRNLLWHLPMVMEYEQLRCQVCMAEFTTLPSVESHLRRVHGIRLVQSHRNCSLNGTVISVMVILCTCPSSTIRLLMPLVRFYQWCRSGCAVIIYGIFNGNGLTLLSSIHQQRNTFPEMHRYFGKLLILSLHYERML
jgi:hypothetical protein